MATIKDIAEAAGISIGTVDRIIHKRGRYSEKTAEKVRRIMEELNYRPNIHARGLKRTRNYRFAVVIPEAEQDSAYWRLVLRGVEKAAGELSAFGVLADVYHFDRYAPESAVESLGKAMASEPDGLLAAPSCPDEMKALFRDTEIPYLFIDTDIPTLTNKLSCIGQDSRQSGILSGKLMSLLLKTGPFPEEELLLIDPPGENYHLRERMAGFHQYLKESGPPCAASILKENTDGEKEFHLSLDDCFRGRSSAPAGIFVANSSVYYAASWMEKRGGVWPSVPLIGYDLIPGREAFIERGTIDFILTQQPEEQGYKGLMKLYDSQVLGRSLEKNFIIPLNIITKENLHTFGRRE